jgi:hypothetical protein
MKRFILFFTCLLAAATCYFGATATSPDFTAFSPPGLNAVIDSALPCMAMAAAVMPVPADIAGRLKDFFTRYSTSDLVYENGGVLFLNRGEADSFGKGKTAEYTREQVMREAENTLNSGLPDIAEIDLLTLKQPELAALAKKLNLETAGKKAETLLAALTGYKVQQQSQSGSE